MKGYEDFTFGFLFHALQASELSHRWLCANFYVSKWHLNVSPVMQNLLPVQDIYVS